MHRLVLRPLLVVVTLSLLSVALVQSVGRLGFAVLDDLELALNQWLSADQIRVTGLSGSWRMLNPIVSMEQVDFPAGHIGGLVVEFDWLESLIRNRLVARRIFVAQGLLELEPDGSGGWRLRGATGDSDVDLDGLLYHSDQIQINASMVLGDRDGGAGAAYRLNYVATNRGGQHRHRLQVGNAAPAAVLGAAGCGTSCEARFELQAREGLWPLWQDELQLQGEVAGLRVPVTPENFAVAQMRVAWHRLASVSGGRFSLEVGDIALPADVTVAVQLAGQVAGSDGSHRGVIDEFRFTHGGRDAAAVAATWELPELRLRVEESFAEVWAGSMDLALAGEFLGGALAGIERPSRWLRELNVDATALNFRARLDWPSWQVGYAATLADLALDGYRGAPYIRGGAGELIGYRRGIQFNLSGQNMLLQFPATFRDTWELAYAQGMVQMWFNDGYVGTRGPSVRFRTPTHRASGGFAITRPQDRREERLTLLVDLGDLDLAQARTYVPYTISAGLGQWLAAGPREGLFVQPRFGYHGHVHGQPGALDRRVELTSGLAAARIRYHDEWPEISGLTGGLVLAGPTVRIDVAEAHTGGASLLEGSRVVLRNNAEFADVELLALAPTDQALDFIRSTPLAEPMAFVDPSWMGDGQLSFTGALHIPLGDDEPADELAVDLNVGLLRTSFDMPDLRLAFDDLRGEIRYRYPNTLAGSGIIGTTFGRPTLISARSDPQAMILRVEGSATHDDVLYVLEQEDPQVAAGQVDFAAELHVGAAADSVTRLDITTDLVGAALSLPGEFAKAADEPRTLNLSVQFFDDYQLVGFDHHSTAAATAAVASDSRVKGWLHVDEQLLRGAVGFNAAAHPEDLSADYVVLTGRLGGFALDQVVPDDGAAGDTGVPIKLANLRVGVIDVDDMQIADAILNGDITADGFAINVASPMLGGDFRLQGDEPLVANIEYIALPEPEDEDADPLSVSVIPDLPEAAVTVGSLKVGDFDYGQWRFDVVALEGGVNFKNLEAELHGVSVKAPDGVVWNAADNRSQFVGEVSVGDLAEVLPHWGYAPSLETRSGSFVGEVAWGGSPANIDVQRLVGTAKIRAKDGRFIDVESGGGAVRIFSLMNFNTIAKRMRGDFSDVTGKGLAFDKLKATIHFDEGQLEFVDPLKVTGTGSRFEVGGSVNLVEGTLDNEMVVTLPVNKSLPWYGVYLALANPLAGAGIIVGERVLRKPIEAFSSAKYEISGTIDEPIVNLVSVFDTSMEEHDSKAAPAETEAVLEAEHNAATVADDRERPEI